MRNAGLIFLLVAYLIVAVSHSLAIPLSKGPDEYDNFLYAKFIVSQGRLPTTVAERKAVGVKADWPPLYHLAVAAAMSGVDLAPPPVLKLSGDTPQRQLIDLVLPRGATVIRTADEQWPLKGVHLGWYVGRWLSILFSAGTIALTYAVARTVYPSRRSLALGAAALLAFAPRFQYTSAVLADDTLQGVLVALYFLLVVLWVKGPDNWWLPASLGFVLGLAMVVKYSVGFVPLGIALVAWFLKRQRNWGWAGYLKKLLVIGGSATVAASWWPLWVARYFNQIDELGVLSGIIVPLVPGAFADNNPTMTQMSGLITGGTIDGISAVPGGGYSYWDWVTHNFQTYWGVGVSGVPFNYPESGLILCMLLLSGLAAAGLWKVYFSGSASQRLWVSLLVLHPMLFAPLSLIRFSVSRRVNDAAQGRQILFPAGIALSILLLWGLYALVGKKRQHYLAITVGGMMLLWSLLNLNYLWHAFPAHLPVRTASAPLAATTSEAIQAMFGETLALLGHEAELDSKHERLDLTLIWHVLAQVDQDYRTEISLIDQEGQRRRRWLSQPASGRYPTRAWDAGDTIRDNLTIPLIGLEGGTYQIELRLLGWEQPLATDHGDAVPLLAIAINPGLYSFSRQLDLSGQDAAPILNFGLWPGRRMASGDLPDYRYRATIAIVTSEPSLAGSAWRLNLTGPDGRPQQPDQVGDGLHLFMVDHEWPSGTYGLTTELWSAEAGILADGDYEALLKVSNRPWQFEAPSINHRVDANFGGDVMLLGYELPLRRVKQGGELPVTLYWQALRQMNRDYVMFDHLLDTKQQVWGGYDRVPRENYNTFLWVPGEVVNDGFILPIDPATPDGIYELDIGLYLEQSGQASSIPLIQDGQPVDANSVTIGPIKVGGPPANTVLSAQDLRPQRGLSLELGQPAVILLHGYSLTYEDDGLHLSLYWENLAPTAVDWSVFVHIRNEAGQIVSQKDGPVGGGRYPTSLWDAGEIITDRIILGQPAELGAGKYFLKIGLYNLETGRRLTVPNSEDNSIELTEIDVPS